MHASYRFSFEPDWYSAPVAPWTHLRVPGTTAYSPPAPLPVLHRGYAFLHVLFDAVELSFSAPAQLDRMIAVLDHTPLPTPRRLCAASGVPSGPNGHWLSRLPVALKSPRGRGRLVHELRRVRALVVGPDDDTRFLWDLPEDVPDPRRPPFPDRARPIDRRPEHPSSA
jgi:hypothetical protein